MKKESKETLIKTCFELNDFIFSEHFKSLEYPHHTIYNICGDRGSKRTRRFMQIYKFWPQFFVFPQKDSIFAHPFGVNGREA